MKSSNVIGIDIGFGYTKVFGDKVSSIFPSQVSKQISRGVFGKKAEVVFVDGQSFVVGNDIDGFGDYSVAKDFVGTPEYLAMLGKALLVAGTRQDILVMGLPPLFYDEERCKKLTDLIRGTRFSTGNGQIIHVPETIRFIPQGAGIFYDFAWSSQQRNKQAQHGNILVIDIGEFTLDIVLFQKGQYDSGAGISHPLGINLLINNIKKEFSKVHGEFLNNDNNVLKLIREGQFSYLDRTYQLDVSKHLSEYINDHVLKAINNFASSIRSSKTKLVDIVVMAGGGVKCIGQLISKEVAVTDDPQMSNARGYYNYGKREVAPALSAAPDKSEEKTENTEKKENAETRTAAA